METELPKGPAPTIENRVQVTVHLPAALVQRIEAAATRRRVSKGEVIRSLLKRALR